MKQQRRLGARHSNSYLKYHGGPACPTSPAWRRLPPRTDHLPAARPPALPALAPPFTPSLSPPPPLPIHCRVLGNNIRRHPPRRSGGHARRQGAPPAPLPCGGPPLPTRPKPRQEPCALPAPALPTVLLRLTLCPSLSDLTLLSYPTLSSCHCAPANAVPGCPRRPSPSVSARLSKCIATRGMGTDRVPGRQENKRRRSSAANERRCHDDARWAPHGARPLNPPPAATCSPLLIASGPSKAPPVPRSKGLLVAPAPAPAPSGLHRPQGALLQSAAVGSRPTGS